MDVDLLIVGGGINGAGIARDAAGRGISVMLVEKDDLASHTSSASSKLVHGGLRYLEQFDFKLVRESLAERERLLRAAPHIVEPLQFIVPVGQGSRPAWMLRAGLLLYDRLAGRGMLPGSRAVRLDRDALGEGLSPPVRQGFTYWDCRVQDSRLVVLNALDAAERGATILTRTELIEARREDGAWTAQLRGPTGDRSIRARVLVNAAGPWAADLFGRATELKPRRSIRLVKGSHIVLPRLYDGDHAFVLQNPDGRVVFAIPFEERFTLVGTTEVPCDRPLDHPAISDAEVDYLLATVGRTFSRTVSSGDVVWSYSGLRALVDDGAFAPSRVTRDYVLELDVKGAPLLGVLGGKLTTYRRLAERALDRLTPYLPDATSAWTGRAFLPGGVIPDGDLEAYWRGLAEQYGALPAELLSRLVRTYGTRAERLLEGVRTVPDLGKHFGGGLYAREVDYLVASEWARSAEDILFRRTKLGLHLEPGAANRLTAYLGC
jgi:glycerol-3-phosphate dehydrogenase